jgi:hypothetical protein
MKDQEILNNAPADVTNYSMEKEQYWDWPNRITKTVEFGDLDSTYPDDFRSIADVKELVQLRQENADLRLKTCTLDLTKGHLSQCEEALESLNTLNESLTSENAELKKSMDGICIAVFDNRGKAVTEHTLSITREATTQFNLPLKVSKR